MVHEPMEMKGLNFRMSASATISNYWYGGSNWPKLNELEEAERQGGALYSHSTGNVQLLRIDPRLGSTTRTPPEELLTKCEEAFRARYPDARRITAEEFELMRQRIKKAQASSAKAKERREFVDSILAGGGGSKTDTATDTLRFLNGERSGGSSLTMQGDVLTYYGIPMLVRIGPDEYLLGRELSGFGSNNSSAASRILTVLALQVGITIWPAAMEGGYRTDLKELANPNNGWVRVLMWCTQALKISQVKAPNAKKNRVAYDQIHEMAKRVLLRMIKRWPQSINSEGMKECQQMIEAYGDKKQMKALNDALYMQYKLTKEK